MKLLITTTAYPPSVGGAQNNLHQLCKSFARDHAVRVASFWGSNRTDWLMGTTWQAPDNPPYQLDGVDVMPIQLSRSEKIALSPYVLSYYLSQAHAIEKISNLLLPKLRQIAGEVDLVHHGRIGREPLGFASLKLARELGVPLILSVYHHPRWNTWLYRHYHALYRQADALIALTQFEKGTLARLGVPPERIFVAGHGAVLSETYDPAQFRQQYHLAGPMVLFLGQKYAYKGIGTLLKAAPLVWAAHPETQFVFMGPRTHYSERLFRGVKDERICEMGIVDLATKTSALAACDVLCLPSTQECFGGVFVEAWKMGKPVIGVETPALAEVVTDGVDGFIGPNEPAFLAEKICRLLDDPSLARGMGEAGRSKVAQNYEWPILAGRVEEIYHEAMQRKRANVEVSGWN